MKQLNSKHEIIRKLTLVAILTALTAVLSYVKIPIVSATTVTLVLPVVVIGAVICGPLVGAWLTVIPNIVSLPEAALFIEYNPIGAIATMLLKGLFAGLAAGLVYKLLSKKHPIGAVTCAAAIAPVINSGIFLLGCYLFLWDLLVSMARENSVGIGMLIFGLAGMNFIVELILNLILCPTFMRIMDIAAKKGFFKNKNV